MTTEPTPPAPADRVGPAAGPSAHPTDRVADAVVIGGGPAGASAAATLAAAGLEVVLVDRATFPRDKYCGDGLTTWALRQLDDLGLDPADVPSWRWVERCFVQGPAGHRIELPLPSDGRFAAVARRHELDAAVLDRARHAGATVVEGDGGAGAVQDGDGVTITLDGGGSVRARYAIGADGMWSPLRKFLGAATTGYRGDWHAFRQYFTGVTGPAAHDLLVWFEPDFLPGYAWSFPLGGGAANVGFGIPRDGRWRVGAMSQLWSEILARPHLRQALGPDAVPESPARAWPIPCRIGALPLVAGRAMFVGDAAAAADGLTGEGIGQALATGRWAAEAIITHPGDPTRAGASYREMVEHELVADERMSATLSRALSHRKGARTAIRVAGLTPWTRRNFSRWLFEDYPRAIVFTPRRWQRHILTRPGAY